VLKDAGYDGTPIVLLHPTDQNVLTNLAPVAKHLMEKAVIKVDMQSMDMQTLGDARAVQSATPSRKAAGMPYWSHPHRSMPSIL
jgi:peptide/nickel transport system substrate-binding protein